MSKIKVLKFYITITIFVSFITVSINAAPSIYGRLDLALTSTDKESTGTVSDVKSHASRVGIKGSQVFDDGTTVIYQYEWQVDPVDGDPTFKQRNSYIGLKGAFGKFFLGMHDLSLIHI